MQILTPDRVDALLAAANAAPSADNRHVVRLECSHQRLLVWPSEALASASGTRRVLGLLSVGAVAENLMLRAAQLGVRLQPNWLGQRDDAAPLVDFAAYEEASPAPDILAGAIAGRHTNRRAFFRGPRLTATAQQAMSAQAGAVPGTELLWLDGPERRGKALQLIRWAEAERFRNRELHAELFESIRFDVGWRAPSAVGLPPGSLELPLFERPAFALLRNWNVQRLANALGAHHFIGWRGAGLPCRLAPHLCAVAASGGEEAAAVSAGRLLQRVWLQATVLGLGFQVFAASAVYALEGSTAISYALRNCLATGWKALSPNAQVYIVFRMGTAAPASVRTARPDAQGLLLLDSTSHEGAVV